MQIKSQISLTRKVLYAIMLLGIFCSAFDAGNLPAASAQEWATLTTAPEVIAQAEPLAQTSDPACPPFDPALIHDKDFLQSLPPECAKAYNKLTQVADQANIQQVMPMTTGGPDAFGYTYDDSVSYSWVAASKDTGISGDNEISGAVDIGFDFPFYGITYSQLYFNTNGGITFGNGSHAYGGFAIPGTSIPNNLIAPFWEDLAVGSPYNSGAIFSSQGGIIPNRFFILEWRDVTTYNGTSPFSFEAILYENGDIMTQLESLPASYSSTVGIENSAGDEGLQYQKGPSGLSAMKAVRYYYPTAATARVSLSPLESVSLSAIGGVVDFALTIANSGNLGADTYNLTAVSTWPVTFYASDGITALTDTDGDVDSKVDTGPILKGKTVIIHAKVTMSVGAVVGQSNSATVTATSSLDTKSKTATLQSIVPASFAQVYRDSAGGAMSLDLVHPDTHVVNNIAPNLYYSFDMAMTAVPNGNFICVWMKYRDVGGVIVREIYYTLLDHNGDTVRAVSKLTDYSRATVNTSDYAPSVAVAPNGIIGVVWKHNHGNDNIYFATLDASGKLLTGPTNITNSTANVPYYATPTIAASDDNRFILSWGQYVYLPSYVENIWYATRDTAGASVFAPAALTSDNMSWGPVLNSLTGGKAILTWIKSGGGSTYAVINSSGAITKSATSLNNTTYTDSPDAVLLPNGKVAITWPTATGIQIAILNSSYVLESGPNSANNPYLTDGYDLSVTTDSSSRVIMTWRDEYNLFYALGDSTGAFLTPPMLYKTSADYYITTSHNGQGNALYNTDVTFYLLTVSKSGIGSSSTVTSSPAGINCGTDCSELYASNTSVTLTAIPASSYMFTGWSGACSGIGSCIVSMTAAKSVTANFTVYPYLPVSKWTSTFDLSHGWTVQNYVRTVGDVNKDGKADLIGFGQDGVYVAISTGTGFGDPTQWSTGFGLANGWTVQSYVRTVGDISGDGRADLVGFGADGVYVALSTGTGFGDPTRWSTGFGLANGWTVQDYVRTVGDISGDGKADLVGFGADGVYVAVSTGTGFGSPTQWSTAFGLANGWTVQNYVRTVGDVNNDSKVDIIGFGQDGVYMALSTGSGFGSISRWTDDFDLSRGWTVQNYVRTVGDVNLDGKADLVGFGQDGVYVAIAR